MGWGWRGDVGDKVGNEAEDEAGAEDEAEDEGEDDVEVKVRTRLSKGVEDRICKAIPQSRHGPWSGMYHDLC